MSAFNMPPGVSPGDIPGNGPKPEQAKKMETALDLLFRCEDLHRDMTVRQYLYTLLDTLWDEEEGFSGKRPFGNSGWKQDIFDALIRNGFLAGKEEEGYYYPNSMKKADAFVRELIKYALLGE